MEMGSISRKCVQPYLIAMDFVTLRFLNYKTDFVNGFAHIKFFFLIRLTKFLMRHCLSFLEKAPSGFTKLLPEVGFTSFKIHP